MYIIVSGGKEGGLKAEEHPPNREAQKWWHHVELIWSRRQCCTSQSRWHHEESYADVFEQYLSTSVRKLVTNGSYKWTMTRTTLPKLWQYSLRTALSDKNDLTRSLIKIYIDIEDQFCTFFSQSVCCLFLLFELLLVACRWKRNWAGLCYTQTFSSSTQ